MVNQPYKNSIPEFKRNGSNRENFSTNEDSTSPQDNRKPRKQLNKASEEFTEDNQSFDSTNALKGSPGKNYNGKGKNKSSKPAKYETYEGDNNYDNRGVADQGMSKGNNKYNSYGQMRQMTVNSPHHNEIYGKVYFPLINHLKTRL